MLLNRTALLRSEGAALVTVLAVIAVTAIVGVSITASVISANGFSTSTRADVQSRAAADAGIDAAFASIYGGSFVCSATGTGDLGYDATVGYRDEAGTAIACSGSVALGTPTSAVITSTGYSQDDATQGTRGNQHTVQATVTITPAEGSGGDLDKAVFSESGFTLTNNNQLVESSDDANDANVYSNGTIVCKTQVDVEGVLYAQGDVSLENSCTTYSDMWAGGNVSFSSQAVVNGDAYIAGTGTMNLSTGHVAGSVITNGAVTMSNNGGVLACPSSAAAKAVCGSVVALGGSVYAGNGASIGGSAYAKTTVTLDNFNGASGVGRNVVAVGGNFVTNTNSQHGKVGGWVKSGGTITASTSAITDKANSCQKTAGGGYVACVGALSIPAPVPAIVLPEDLGYPTTAVVNKPPREQMPQINSAASDLAAWTADGWTVTKFTATVSGKSTCQQAKEFIATPRAGKNLVVVTNCAEPVTWDNTTLTLGGDLALMSSTGFETRNQFTVQSNNSTLRGFMFIVPADATYITRSAVTGTNPTQYKPTCTPQSNTKIGQINNNNTTSINVAWLLYTPCYLGFQNQLNGFKGQLYGGSVNYPNNSTIQLVKFAVPGISSDGSDSNDGSEGSAAITSRTDVKPAG
jgi:hypothetical protein